METVNELRFLFRIQLVGVLFVSKEIFFSSMDTGFGKGKVVVVEHRGAFIKQSKLLFAFSIGSKLLFAFSIGRLMNVKLAFSISLLNLGLLSQFNKDFVVTNRSPKEVQNQTSFGLLFDTGIEKANNEVEFASN